MTIPAADLARYKALAERYRTFSSSAARELITEVEALRALLETAEKALHQGAVWFEDYGIGHQLIGATDKAQRNFERMGVLRAALAEIAAKGETR